jgi:hypothetical protein
VDGFDPGDNTNQEPPRKITLNDEFKNDSRTSCIYEKLKKMIEQGNDNLFWRMTLPFSGNGPRLEINLLDSSQVKIEGYSGSFRYNDSISSKGKFVIDINRQDMQKSSDIAVARTLLSIIMRAYVHAKVHQSGGTDSLKVYTGNDPTLLDMKGSIQDSIDWQWTLSDWLTNYLAKPFLRESLVTALKAFMGDLSGVITDYRYNALVWQTVQNSRPCRKLNIGERDDIRTLGNDTSNPSIYDQCK